MAQEQDRITEMAPDLKVHRILNGMWQVSGSHGHIDQKKAIDAMEKFVRKGFITWDLADHYGPAEDFVKLFREQMIAQNKENMLKDVKFFTKWVPRPQKISKKVVKKAIDLSRTRMGMDVLDMIQFHWWDYDDKNYLKAMEYLDDLRKEGIITHLSLTNFDTAHLEEFINRGIKITSNQVQYSLIDRRPERLMQDLCEKHDIKLLAYGTLGGGLLSERYLEKPEPSYSSLNTASLYKYKRMVDRWGDWSLFQRFLRVLSEIADKHNVSIANVAVRYVLESPVVAGAIVGVRLGISEHIEDNLRVFSFSLDSEDNSKIEEILNESNDLMKIIGDCGDEYR